MSGLCTQLTVDEVKSATFETSSHKFLRWNSFFKVSNISDFLFSAQSKSKETEMNTLIKYIGFTPGHALQLGDVNK